MTCFADKTIGRCFKIHFDLWCGGTWSHFVFAGAGAKLQAVKIAWGLYGLVPGVQGWDDTHCTTVSQRLAVVALRKCAALSKLTPTCMTCRPTLVKNPTLKLIKITQCQSFTWVSCWEVIRNCNAICFTQTHQTIQIMSHYNLNRIAVNKVLNFSLF